MRSGDAIRANALREAVGQFVAIRENALNEAKKPKPVSTGPGGEHHTSAFIQRCVAAMTAKGEKDLSRAFAICTAAQKKHPEAAKEKAKEGVPKARVKQFEKALKLGREARRKSESIEEGGWGRRYTKFSASQEKQKHMLTVIVESQTDANKTVEDIKDAIGKIRGMKVVEIHVEKD